MYRCLSNIWRSAYTCAHIIKNFYVTLLHFKGLIKFSGNNLKIGRATYLKRCCCCFVLFFFSVYIGYFGMELITQTKLPRDGHHHILRQSEDKMLAFRCNILFVILIINCKAYFYAKLELNMGVISWKLDIFTQVVIHIANLQGLLIYEKLVNFDYLIYF